MGKIDKMAEAIHAELKREGRVTISSREMTSLDEITHNFTEDPGYTRLMLEKHGQVFIGGRRITL